MDAPSILQGQWQRQHARETPTQMVTAPPTSHHHTHHQQRTSVNNSPAQPQVLQTPTTCHPKPYKTTLLYHTPIHTTVHTTSPPYDIHTKITRTPYHTKLSTHTHYKKSQPSHTYPIRPTADHPPSPLQIAAPGTWRPHTYAPPPD